MKLRIILSLLIVSFFIACSAQMNTATQPANTQNTQTSAITIKDFAFNPNSVTVSAGTTVTWTNNDPYPHQIASDTKVFGSDPLQNGATYSFTFNTKGTYTYHCAIHPSMTGTIIVQ